MKFRSERDADGEQSVLVAFRLEPFPVDVSDRGEEFVVAAVLIGVDRDRIDVRVDDRRVEIVAERAAADADDPPLRREIRLPTAVEPSTTSVAFTDGILELHLPKRDVEPQ